MAGVSVRVVNGVERISKLKPSEYLGQPMAVCTSLKLTCSDLFQVRFSHSISPGQRRGAAASSLASVAGQRKWRVRSCISRSEGHISGVIQRTRLRRSGNERQHLREPKFQSHTQRCGTLKQGTCFSYVSAPGPTNTDIAENDDVEEQQEEPKKQDPVINWALVWRLLSAERLRLLLILPTMLLASYSTLSMPLVSGNLVEVLVGRRQEPLWRMLAHLAMLYVLELGTTVMFVTSMITVWEKVMAGLRNRVFGRLLIQKMEFFDRHRVAELTGLLTVELKAVEGIVNDNVSRDRGLRGLCEVIGALAILFSISPSLAPPLCFLVVGVSVSVGIYKSIVAGLFKAHLQSQVRLGESAAETLGTIRTVRAFSGERRQMLGFKTQVDAVQRSGIQLGWLKSANEGWTRFTIYVSLLALYILGGYKVQAGELAVGSLISFIGYTFSLTFATQGLVNSYGDLRNFVSAVERINRLTSEVEIDWALARGIGRELSGTTAEVCAKEREKRKATVGEGGGEVGADVGADWALRMKAEDVGLRENAAVAEALIAPVVEEGATVRVVTVNGQPYVVPAGEIVPGEEGKRTGVCELAWQGDIALEGVYFAYPARPDQKILRGLSLKLPCGKVTALVGSSGSGKSTCVQLLSRFYDPTVGRITLNGIDIRHFDKSEWTRAVSVVNQEPVLFAMSIRDNIAYALPDGEATEEAIVAAAKVANAHSFIEKLSQGYDTQVGERGGLLSGGQKQRIAIARAILKNSPILILDEATSALDSVSEGLVQEALDRLMKGRTTLVVAHRLSTVQRADQIAVVSHGEIVEVGSHSRLTDLGGHYATLVDNQRLILQV